MNEFRTQSGLLRALMIVTLALQIVLLGWMQAPAQTGGDAPLVCSSSFYAPHDAPDPASRGQACPDCILGACAGLTALTPLAGAPAPFDYAVAIGRIAPRPSPVAAARAPEFSILPRAPPIPGLPV